MNNRELSVYLNVSEGTIYNWKKEKPNLYQVVMNFKDKKAEINKEDTSILQLLEQLEPEEKRMYLLEIESRILRKRLK